MKQVTLLATAVTATALLIGCGAAPPEQEGGVLSVLEGTLTGKIAMAGGVISVDVNDAGCVTGSGQPDPYAVVYCSLQDAIADAASGDTINVAGGTYAETGQIVIGKDLAIVGNPSDKPVFVPTQNTGSSGDPRGWWLVQAGSHLDLADVVLDGAGYQIYQGIRAHGTGTVDNCEFHNMDYSTYIGMAIAFMDANWTITDSLFTNCRRLGVIAFGSGVTNAVMSGNTYVGKGVGDWLDYGIELGGGAVATLTDNQITNCKGVASSDGSTSAGILITTYYAAGTGGTLTGNVVTGNTTGIAVGYDSSDTSVVIASQNDLSGNDEGGLYSTSATETVDASTNWWAVTDPDDVAAEIDGWVDYTPWLASGDADAGTFGFQADLSVLYVDDNSPQVGATGRVQEAVDLVTASTINVAAGTYDENLVVDKSMTLNGAQAGVDARYRVATESEITASSGHVIDVRASNVTIDGFKITGSASAGQLVRCESGGNGLQLLNSILGGTAARILWFNTDASNVLIEQNRLEGASMSDSYALAHFDGSDVFDNLTVPNNIFYDGGIFAGNMVFNSTNMTMSGNLFDGASLNLSSQFKNSTISGNLFRNNGYTNMQVGLKDSSIVGNVFGLAGPSPHVGYPSSAMMLWGDQYGLTPSENVTIEDNVIHFNGVALPDDLANGLRVLSGIDATTITVTGNCFYDGGAQVGAIALLNQASGVVPAEYNWWDHESGPYDPNGTEETDGVTCYDPATMSNADGQGGEVTDQIVDYCPWSDGPHVIGLNILWLNANGAPVYVRPDDDVIVDLTALNLMQKVTAVQALVGYSTTYLDSPSAVVGGYPWDVLIYQNIPAGGEYDAAIGVNVDLIQSSDGTDADATTAVITFTVPTGAPDGTTRVVFRPDGMAGYETFYSWINPITGEPEPVYPTKIDSQTIVVDGTDPDVQVTYPNGGENFKGGGSETITWTASDTNIDYDSVKIEYFDGADWVTLATDEDNDGAHLWSPIPSLDIDTSRVRVTVWDLAGNSASDESDADFTIDSTSPVISIDSAQQNSVELLVENASTTNAVQGTVDIIVTASDDPPGSGLASHPTVDVTPASQTDSVTGAAASIKYYYDGSTGILDLTAGNREWALTVTDIDLSALSAGGAFNINFGDEGTGSGSEKVHVQVHKDFYGAGGHLLQAYGKWWNGPLSSHGFNPGDVPGTFDLRFVMKQNGDSTWHIKPQFRLPSGQWTTFYDGEYDTTAAFDLTASMVEPQIDAGSSGTASFSPATAVAYVSESPTGTFNYQFVVAAHTPNGQAAVDATVSDNAGNSASAATKHFNINKDQITGTVELELLNPPVGGITRTVTFVATGGAQKSWDVPVDFAAASSTGTYVLTDVPSGTTDLSAKTAWNLRSKIAVSWAANGQGTADFVGADKLLGGDLNADNIVNTLDYTIYATNYNTTNDVADINGDGFVNTLDYNLISVNFFKNGEAP